MWVRVALFILVRDSYETNMNNAIKSACYSTDDTQLTILFLFFFKCQLYRYLSIRWPVRIPLSTQLTILLRMPIKLF